VSEFIILGQERSEMVLCDICPDPGLCCRNFDSTLTYWDDAQPEEVQQYIDFLNGGPMPWIPRGPGTKKFESGGRQYSHWKFDCRKLDSNGRCTIYADRPRACRTFIPGATEICAFHKILPAKKLENGELVPAYST